MLHRRRLLEQPWSYDFFTVMRLVERAATDRPRIGESANLAEEAVRLGQDPFLEFPAAAVAGARERDDRRLHLLVRFLGLFGPQGALPISTTEETYGWLLARDDAFPRFGDVFQNRFLQLFYRAWAESRPIVQADRPEHDRFARWIASLAGIATPAVREGDTLPLAAKLGHAGLLGPQVRSASRLETYLESLFGRRIEVVEFVGSWLVLDAAEQSRLGPGSALGVDTFVGAGCFSVTDKFRIRVHVPDIEAYGDFLPTGRRARHLLDAVTLMMGIDLDWDVEIALPARAVPPARLGAGGGRLGWTSWLVDPNTDPGDGERADARFHLTSRHAATAAAAS